MKAESPALGPLGLGPVGQVRIYLGSAHRFIWPVHLAGWLELGWTTEPMATTGGTPRVTSGAIGPGVTSGAIGPGVTTAPRKKRVSSSPTGVSSSGGNPSGASTISATADEPLPVLVTDFLDDPSVPTND